MRRKQNSWVPLALGLALVGAIAILMMRGIQDASRLSDQEGMRMVEESIERAIISCYSLEGVYPASYEELKEKIGLEVDEEKYIVIYEIFASNIRPSVTVMERQAERR